jgi:hypothetical protein
VSITCTSTDHDQFAHGGRNGFGTLYARRRVFPLFGGNALIAVAVHTSTPRMIRAEATRVRRPMLHCTGCPSPSSAMGLGRAKTQARCSAGRVGVSSIPPISRTPGFSPGRGCCHPLPLVSLYPTRLTRQALDDYLCITGVKSGDYLFPGRRGPDRPLTTRQYARLVSEWVSRIGLDRLKFATHSMRRYAESRVIPILLASRPVRHRH